MSSKDGAADQVTGFARWLERALAAAATACHRHPWRAVGIALVLTVVSALATSKLHIDTSMRSLLPRSFRSVVDTERLEKVFGGVGYVAVVARNAPPEQLKKFAEDTAPRIEALPSIAHVNYKRPDAWFKKRALYYLETDDLEEVSDRIQDRVDHEKKKANPLFVDVEDAAPPELDFSELQEKYNEKIRGHRPKNLNTAEPYILDSKERIIVLLAKPLLMATDLKFSRDVVGHVQGLIDQIDLSAYGPDMQVKLTGRYIKKLDMQVVIERDVKRLSALALFLVLLYLGLHFRRAASVLFLIVPMLAGIVWTLAAGYLLFGALNILTAFIGAIILGVGIDHGIHLLSRYQFERRAGVDPEQAIERTFGNTGRAVILAAITTTLGFLGLSVSEFRAFREFGVMTAVGMVTAVSAYTLILPAMLALIASPEKAGASRPQRWSLLRAWGRIVPKWGPSIFWITTVIASGAAWQSRDFRFDYDFASLEANDLPSFALDATVNRVLGRSQTPVVLLIDDKANEQEAARVIRERMEKAKASSNIDFVLAASDLVPGEQTEKQEILQELSEALKAVDPDRLSDKDRRRFDELREMTSAAPFSRDDLPEQLQRLLRPREGSGFDGSLLLVFPSIKLSDGERLPALAEEVRNIPLPDGQTVSAAGEAMVLADILNMVFTESPRVCAATFVLIFISLWLLLGSLRRTIACLSPAVLTLLCTFGVMPLIGLELNYLNMVILPVLFGLAVDGGVHLVIRGATSPEDLEQSIDEVGRAVTGACITSVLGFGILEFAHHGGLQSFGRLALIGLAANVVATLVWLTSLLALRHIREVRLSEVGLSATWVARFTGDLSTVWGAGYSPLGPGTFGSIAALPLGFLLAQIGWQPRAAILVIGTLLSLVIGRAYVAGGTEDLDPSEVVLDELIGVLIALAFVPWELPWVVAAFVLFRLFDIAKPGPVGWADRNLKNYVGIMLDDVIAGLMAGGVLMVARVVLASV